MKKFLIERWQNGKWLPIWSGTMKTDQIIRECEYRVNRGETIRLTNRKTTIYQGGIDLEKVA